MKRFSALLATSAAVSLLMVSSAQAVSPQNNWYLGLSGDLTWMRHSDIGGGGNVALGYRANNFRLEGEVGYHGADGDDGYSGTHYISYMGNAYYDFNRMLGSSSGSSWQVVPYIGGGVGVASVRFGHANVGDTFRHHDNTFTYQGMAGLGMVSASMPNTDWSIGYRYLGTDKHNIHSNSAELGLRFHF